VKIVLGETPNVTVVVPPELVVTVKLPQRPTLVIQDVAPIPLSFTPMPRPNLYVPVIPGSRGEKGDPGLPGAPGLNGTGLMSWTYIQPVPSDTWVIEHPLEYKPSVTIVDSAGSVVYGDVSYSEQTVTVRFSAGFSGTAYLS
jgi:hypothetical protein